MGKVKHLYLYDMDYKPDNCIHTFHTQITAESRLEAERILREKPRTGTVEMIKFNWERML